MTNHIIKRITDDELQRSLNTPLITVILGPRQTGKTTSANSLLRPIQEDRKLSLNLDSSMTRDIITKNESFLLDSIESIIGIPFNELSDRFYLFIDEAQKCPKIFEIIKKLYDSFSPQLKIILTGSATLEIMDKTAETLAGRIQTFHMYPFTIAEAGLYAGFGNIDSTKQLFNNLFRGTLNDTFLKEIERKKRPRSQKIKSLIQNLITRSLFPPTYSRIEENDIERWLVDYIDTYIERDMRSLSEIGNIDGYKKTIIQLSHRTSSLLNYKSLANDSIVNQITVKKYIAFWEQSLTGKRISPFFINTSTRIRKAQKITFVDNGLVWALTGFPGQELLRAAGKIGLLFENLIINEFFKYAVLFPKRPQIFFWEKSQVTEVDIVIQTSGFVIPIEIKSGNSLRASWIKSIKTFKEKHQNVPIPFSMIIYNGEYAKHDDIYCIPAWLFG